MIYELRGPAWTIDTQGHIVVYLGYGFYLNQNGHVIKYEDWGVMCMRPLDSSLDHRKGRRVRLVRCNDQHTKLRPGLLGTVAMVDAVGTLHVEWDDGSTLGLCADDGDQWVMLPEENEDLD